MGTRVEFWEIPKADIKQAVISDLNEIRNWYRSIEEEFPEDVDYDLLVALEEIQTPEKLFEEFDINKINELVAFYIGDFCEYGPGKKKVPIPNTSMWKICNYVNDQDEINEKCNPNTQKLWNFILKGRSITELEKFKISDPVFRFCVLDEAECQTLYEDLDNKFDTLTLNKSDKNFGIASVKEAIENKKGAGILITVA